MEVTKVNSTLVTPNPEPLPSSRAESLVQQLLSPSPAPLAALAFLGPPFTASKAV